MYFARQFLSSFAKLTGLTVVTIAASSAYAGYNEMIANASQTMSTFTLDCSHWYVGANLGVSHLHDQNTPGASSSVDENGPGWNAGFGYQYNSLLGAELGYTQYYNSRENSGSANIARTEHYAVSLAATGRYPLAYKISALGKLGAGYTYALKKYTAGTSLSASSLSPYYALGLDYSMTKTVDFIAQWSRVMGNNHTGGADLVSLGFTFGIV